MRMRPGWIGIATWLALGAGLQTLAQGLQAPAPTEKMYVAPQVETPNFYNMTLQQVDQANETTVGAKEGMVPIFNQVTPLGPLNGVVLFQIPTAGTKVFPGRQRLTVTMGPAPTKVPANTKVPTTDQPARMYVPDVTGMTVDGATARLQTFQLRLGQVTSQTGNWAGLKIVSESPQAGTPVALGTAVGVTLEAPPQPPSQLQVIVPNVVGSTVAQARTALKGLELGPVTGEVKSPVPQTIESQTPVAGTSVVAGTRVGVTLEPPRLKVPNLKGMTVAEAGVNLQSLGLTLGPVLGKNDGAGAVKIVSQTIPAKTPVGFGTEVGVTLENGNGWIVWVVGLLGAVGLGLLLVRVFSPPPPPPLPVVILKPEAKMEKSSLTVSGPLEVRVLVQLRGRPARAQYEVRQRNAIVTRKDSRG